MTEHEKIFWKKELRESDTPKKLLGTFLFLFENNFTHRSRDEHRRLQVENIIKHYDCVLKRSNIKYIQNISKTSKRGIRDNREPKNLERMITA